MKRWLLHNAGIDRVRHISEQNDFMLERAWYLSLSKGSESKNRARRNAGEPQRFCAANMPIKAICVLTFLMFIFSISGWCEAVKQTIPVDISVVLSGADIPQVKIYTVKEGDNLDKIARRHHTTLELIYKINDIKKDIIRPGQKIKVWNEPFTLIVNKKKNILVLKAGDEVVKVYSVATGAGNNTPVGNFTITSRFKNPVWFKKGVAIGPNDPQNALGPRWLGFDKPQYGIHGTIYPDSIGKQASHGCVRMRNLEVIELYDIIPIGTKVKIVD